MQNNNLSKKILTMNQPIITSYPHHAFLFSIFAEDNEALEHLCNYYFQLSIRKLGNNRIDFNNGLKATAFLKNCSLLQYDGLSRKIIREKWSSFSEFVIDCINNEYYLFFDVDTFYVPHYKAYQKYHSGHGLFLFGYDNEAKSFQIADFFENGKYSFKTVSFNTIEEGFAYGDDFDNIKGVALIKKSSNTFSQGIDILIIKQSILEYINSLEQNMLTIPLNTRINQSDCYAFGLEVYDILKDILIRIQNKELEGFPILQSHILWDHKKIVLLTLSMLIKRGYLNNGAYYIDKFDVIEKNALNFRNLILKLSINHNIFAIEKAIIMLNQIKINERDILSNLYNNINDIPVISTSQLQYLFKSTNIETFNKLDTQVEFLGFDKVTKGDWDSVYGKYGHYIVGGTKFIDENIYMNIYKGWQYSWSEETVDIRTLKKDRTSETRIASVKFHEHNINIDMIVWGNTYKDVSFYFLDFDYGDREVCIEIINGVNEKAIYNVTVNNLGDGIYAKFRIKGFVKINIKRVAGNEALLSGIFFDKTI